LSKDCLEEVQGFLKTELTEFDVVTTPDFFLDRLVSIDYNMGRFCGNLERVAEKKGGSLDNITQANFRGGNAVNTASALAALGAKVTPIICTDKLGQQLIRFHLKPERIDFSHVKIFDRASITTALEFEAEDGKVNVMLRDVGSLTDFGVHHLNDKDFDAIDCADYVCVFNWAGTKHFGTELAKKIFRRKKAKGKGKTYCDTADPTPNLKKIPELVKSVLQSKDLDILSVNENEAVCYAAQLSERVATLKKNVRLDELARKSARTLASHLSARIDLHTTNYAATFTGKREIVVPAFRVPVWRATGAGDAWNAGNILGDAHELADDCRLTLANAVAAYYISDPAGKHPSQKQLIKFCEKLKTKRTRSTA